MPVEAATGYLFRVSEALINATPGLGEGQKPPAGGDDLGPRLVPGASPIRHAPYGTPWDSQTPMVLTGKRPGWTPLAWGWEFWQRRHGDQMVIAKQRAPMFQSDQKAATLMAECTLRECMAYCKTAHLDSRCEAGTAPVLYMNGWDVFEAIPELETALESNAP